MVPKQVAVHRHIQQLQGLSPLSSVSTLLEKAARQTAVLHASSTTSNGGTPTNNGALLPPPPPPSSSSFAAAAASSGLSLAAATAPAVLLAGTAAVYASALRHRRSVLTPIAATAMLLLAVQTSLQPTLSKHCIGATVDKKRVSLVEEIIKTALAAVLFYGGQPAAVRHQSLRDWSLASSLTVAAFPAALYAVQGVLTYTAHHHLDAVTFNGLSQTKTVSAALWCYLLLGQTLSLRQGGAIAILCVSAVTFQGLFFVRLRKTEGDGLSSSTTTTTTTTESAFKSADWWYRGILPCLGATFLSGLAGSLSQRGLQMVGAPGGGRNAYLFTIEVSFYSTLSLLLSIVVDKFRTARHGRQSNPQQVQQQHQVQADLLKTKTTSWTAQALIPITLKAIGGVLTALVHKYAGTVAKGFALVLGLVLSGIFQSAWRPNNGKQGAAALEPHQVIGTLLVLWSTWMHLTA